MKSFVVTFFLGPDLRLGDATAKVDELRGTYGILQRYLYTGGKETTRGLSDTGSELTLIPGDPKKHCGPPVKVGTYGGQFISRVLA